MKHHVKQISPNYCREVWDIPYDRNFCLSYEYGCNFWINIVYILKVYRLSIFKWIRIFYTLFLFFGAVLKMEWLKNFFLYSPRVAIFFRINFKCTWKSLIYLSKISSHWIFFFYNVIEWIPILLKTFFDSKILC